MISRFWARKQVILCPKCIENAERARKQVILCPKCIENAERARK